MARPAPRSSRRGRASRPSPIRSGGCGRRSSATSTSSATGCPWSVRTHASSRRAWTAPRWCYGATWRRPPRASGPGPPRTPDAIPVSTGWSGRCRASSASSPGRSHRTSHRRVSAMRWRASASAGRSVAWGVTTAGRSPASCRWPSPTSSPIVRERRRPGGDRLARDPVHRDGALVGRDDRGPARRFGRQRRGSGGPDGLRAWRPRGAGGGAGARRA